MALAYGRNPHNGRTTDPWRIRNVIRWVRPNPPVGALGDKDFLYRQRVWFLKSHDNVCANCSTGCPKRKPKTGT